MGRPKMIIVEGPQGVGKTTVTNWLRDIIPSSNLYRLSGIQDKTNEGKVKCTKMYTALIEYLMGMGISHCGMHLIFDRTFITEQVYSKLGYKDYDFTDVYHYLCFCLVSLSAFYDIIVFNLFLEDMSMYEGRLHRDGKVTYKHSPFNADNSTRQQRAYEDAMEYLGSVSAGHISVINVSMTDDFYKHDIKSHLRDVIDTTT
jgi:energy-coupling factor transporter ATP-binding protein EcfA2